MGRHPNLGEGVQNAKTEVFTIFCVEHMLDSIEQQLRLSLIKTSNIVSFSLNAMVVAKRQFFEVMPK